MNKWKANSVICILFRVDIAKAKYLLKKGARGGRMKQLILFSFFFFLVKYITANSQHHGLHNYINHGDKKKRKNLQMHSLMRFAWQLLSTKSQQPTRNLHFSPLTLFPRNTRRIGKEKWNTESRKKKKQENNQSKRKLTIKPI